MFEQGDVVIIPFPFTDLSASKQRPALIISKSDYNRRSDDVITCGITSNLQNAEHSVLIDNGSFSEGEIPAKSRIKVDKLFTISQSLVRKQVAKLKAEEFEKVRAELHKLV